LPEFAQRIAADHRRQQQPVGPQRAADLREHAGQVVDELKGERGNHEVERCRRQRQRFPLAIMKTDTSDGLEAVARRLAQRLAGRPDIGDIGKIPQHRTQAFGHILGHAVEQERRGPQPQRAGLPRPQQAEVEQIWQGVRVFSHAGWYAGLPVSGNPARLGALRGGGNCRENRPAGSDFGESK
jgi:hypothetical protein